jgi:MFS family permease
VLGISPLSPALVEGFTLSRLQVALIVPSIYLAGLFFSLPGGRLADRLGVRRSFLGGLALGAIGLIAAASAPSFPLFLASLFLAGTGWSVINPALGRAIIDLFPSRERGIAMGIKQMGLTLGGVASALVLPVVAAALGWRAAMLTCSAVVALPVVATWRVLVPLARGVPASAVAGTTSSSRPHSWTWLTRPGLVAFFASGLVLGMVQAAVLSYLPLYAVQALGFDAIGAGRLVACSQAGGAVSRLVLGAASDRWLTGRRSMWLALTGGVGAIVFAGYASHPVVAPLAAGGLAFLSGVGAYGWVGIFFIISAEAGGRRAAGMLSGVAFAAIVIGLLVGPATFGLLLVRWNSYAVAWAVFAALASVVTIATLALGPAIDRERAPA